MHVQTFEWFKIALMFKLAYLSVQEQEAAK